MDLERDGAISNRIVDRLAVSSLKVLAVRTLEVEPYVDSCIAVPEDHRSPIGLHQSRKLSPSDVGRCAVVLDEHKYRYDNHNDGRHCQPHPQVALAPVHRSLATALFS